ncbi:tripartite tricarboxylate transporter substrate binding protein [Achromobacter aloeverae]
MIAILLRPCRAVLLASAAILAAASCPGAAAETYPNHPIRIEVPYAAGGGVDLVARVVAKGLTQSLGQSVIVENKPGGATNVAAEVVARANPDGYTLFIASIANAVNPSLYKSLPFDIEKDFAPISLMADIPNILVVNPSIPAKSVAELIALLKKNPGKYTFASAGVASSTRLSGELFKSMTGTDILHVPYRGGSLAAVDLLSGRVSMYFAAMPSVLGYVRAGKLRALAVTSLQRSGSEPQYPTLDESGLKGFNETSWIGLMSPAGTPPAVIEKLHRAVVAVLKAPEVQAVLRDQGAEVIGSNPGEFADFLHQSIVDTARLVETAHIQPE